MTGLKRSGATQYHHIGETHEEARRGPRTTRPHGRDGGEPATKAARVVAGVALGRGMASWRRGIGGGELRGADPGSSIQGGGRSWRWRHGMATAASFLKPPGFAQPHLRLDLGLHRAGRTEEEMVPLAPTCPARGAGDSDAGIAHRSPQPWELSSL
jgi:hypothetical protein